MVFLISKNGFPTKTWGYPKSGQIYVKSGVILKFRLKHAARARSICIWRKNIHAGGFMFTKLHVKIAFIRIEKHHRLHRCTLVPAWASLVSPRAQCASELHQKQHGWPSPKAQHCCRTDRLCRPKKQILHLCIAAPTILSISAYK